jgi:hypothetical protein
MKFELLVNSGMLHTPIHQTLSDEFQSDLIQKVGTATPQSQKEQLEAFITNELLKWNKG